MQINEQRRNFLRVGVSGAVLTCVSAWPHGRTMAATPVSARRIGVIGSGNVGGTLGRLWVQAGHEVLFSSRHPGELQGLVASLGAAARAGTPREAAEFGDAVLLAVPYGALPQIGHDLAPVLAGKVVLDACNPYAWRDGEAAKLAAQEGSGIASAHFFPGARLVRGFNSIDASAVGSEAHRAPPRIGIPIAGDDAGALEVVASLVHDAGFDPVVAGPLAAARKFEPGGPLFEQTMTASELRRRLDVAAGAGG